MRFQIGLPAQPACNRVVLLYQRKQPLPGHHVFHIIEEELAARLLALAQAFGITECQLDGHSFNVFPMDLTLADQRPAQPPFFAQVCSDIS